MSKFSSYSFFLLSLLLVTPLTSHAAVVISEVAWMGTAVDNGSFCEWVELANTGTESVSLSGWTLKTLDGGMSVPLAGSIDPEAFYLIERSTPTACPDPVPGIDADLTKSFGGGLSNSGEVLILSSGSGEVERIDASGGWEKVVGGNADKKYTAQRNGDAWVTAVGTPKAANATESVAEPESSTSTSKSSSAPKIKGNPVPTLYIDPGPDRIVSTKAHVSYSAIVYDSTGKLIVHPYLAWAFGDGDRQVGRDVEHVYRVPGEYLVVLHAQDGYSLGSSSFVVTADTADLSITDLTDDGVSITNSDTRTLDLSHYELRSGRERFRIPESTSILPGKTVVFPREVTGLSTTTESMTLSYPSGEVLSTFERTAQPSLGIGSSTSMSETDTKTLTELPYEAETAAALRRSAARAL